MTPSDLSRASEVFERALATSGEERERVLREACGGDGALEAEVRSLLAHHDSAQGFLDDSPALAEIEPLHTLGRYRILERLGAGGMGVVYLAEQDNPRRKVALKVLRLGASGTAGRFAHEAELLGRLQHPGIAQIHEAVAGDTQRGTPPYFAMEYVEGRALCDWAAERRLSVGARLELLVAICAAVQHAHQKGVIHRDLKPANILVDGAGQPKVLDFGVARAVGVEERAATLRTRPGEIVGTLAYMSPEQASGDPERLDTRADVYALGVIAYELLAGRLPFDLTRASLSEAVHQIREVAPPRLGRLRRELGGDLETIVAKAMEKEPERRYASASELAEDVRRFLADEPIVARPPSTLYQLRKFARRHSGLVGGSVAFALLLLVAVFVSTRLAVALARERDEAVAVSGFLEDVLAAAEPYVGGKEATIADAVRWAEDRAAERFADRPDVLADLRQRLASIHYSRGELDEALRQATWALAPQEEGEDPLALATSLTSSGTVRHSMGELEPALEELRRALALFDQHGERSDPRRLTALISLSAVLLERGDLEEAEPMMLEALELRLEVHGPEHPYTLTARNNLAQLLMRTERAEEGEEMLLEVMEVSLRTLPEGHPNAIQSIYNYADALRARGELDEAEPLFLEAIELGAKHLPAGNWLTGLHRSRYGELLFEAGRPAEAELELRTGFHILETALGPDHPRTRRASEALSLHLRTADDSVLRPR